jgi:hypothetical protein
MLDLRFSFSGGWICLADVSSSGITKNREKIKGVVGTAAGIRPFHTNTP